LSTKFDPADYDRFSYDGFSVSGDGSEFRAHYSLAGPSSCLTFVETVRLPGRDALLRPPSDRTARLLALACGLSYYKAAAPREVRVTFGLTDAEHEFLVQLIKNGLGEFAFRNQMLQALTPDIVSDRLDAVPRTTTPDSAGGSLAPLIPVGGGKDSVVTIESLKTAGFEPMLFSVNTFTPIERCAAVSGLPLVSASRSIDRRLVAMNDDGAYNGHVPVTAINSLVALLAAERLAVSPVVMSNERSAAHGNLEWHGLSINHQWSKSLQFEELLRSTLSAGGGDSDSYFSLLRPLTEVEIARRFAKLHQYFEAFTSCNRAFALDENRRALAWCRKCAKCQFVFLIMAPFVSRIELERVFGGNLFEDSENLPGYLEILGLRGHKPFECVGEYEEAAMALDMVHRDPAWTRYAMVRRLFEELRDQGKVPAAGVRDALLATGSRHFVPPRFRGALNALA
jgi:UDP-N-acetyl-alpha-D-muramoyl-L-alanyl-L-glutamate epimerase